MTGILDADSLVYQVCYVLEEKNPFKEDSWVIPMGQARDLIDEKIKFIKVKAGVNDLEIFIRGGNNFRYSLMEDYKKSNHARREVTGREELNEYLVEKHGAIRCFNAETDDWVCYYKRKYPEKLLIAIDKDVLMQSEGRHFNYWKGEFIEVSENTARYFKYYQAIIGDTSDGYRGCPGIGPKKAENFINEEMTEDELQLGVIEAFESKGLTRKDAELQVQMADMFQYNPEKDKLSLFNFKV